MNRILAVVLLGLASTAAQAGKLMMVDSGELAGSAERVMLFDDFDGSLSDPNWLVEAAGENWSTPREAQVVGHELWITDQSSDRVLRYSYPDLNYLGAILNLPSGAPLDNLRGMGVLGGTVYVVNGTLGATNANRGIVSYNFAAAPIGFFPTLALSPFDAEPWKGELLISDSTSNAIKRYTTAGAFIANFASVVFPQQVVVDSDDSVVVAASIADAGIEGIYHYNADGSLRTYVNTQPLNVPRCIHPLGDGGYLIGSSDGVHKASWNGSQWVISLVYAAAEGQYITRLPVATGACCRLGVCAVTTQASCVAGGGAYQGDLTTCDPNPCPPAFCLGDADCDGDVDFFDIDPFVAKLGCPGDPSCDAPCAWQNADVDEDGDVDFFDIDPFVGQLGAACR